MKLNSYNLRLRFPTKFTIQTKGNRYIFEIVNQPFASGNENAISPHYFIIGLNLHFIF